VKPLRTAVIFGLVAVAALVIWLLAQSKGKETQIAPQAQQPTSSLSVPNAPSARTPPVAPARRIEEVRRAVAEEVQSVLLTPITFYGRVVDQNGDPVAGATINYGALDKFDAPGSQYQGESDANGNFSISGIRGAVLRVGAQKNGYYMIDGKSASAFAYGISPDSRRKSPPSKNDPAILVLQKMGPTEPLLYLGSRQYKVLKNGQPLELDLQTGRQVEAGKGTIRFERWVNDQTKSMNRRFDWRFRITVPNGGMIERHDQFAFEAPEEGYQTVVEIDMPTSLGSEWRYTVDRSYFIRIRGGLYGRIDATIYGGHNNSLVLESFINPKPNSRNLEFDPKKIVKP
jgi:hypothetical protein